MNKLTKKITSIVLVFAIMFTIATTVSAAPVRNSGSTTYLSDIALIEAADYNQALKILEELKSEKNGSFEGMFELDLNKGGKKGVYLAYKTSKNVDAAITDIAVMNMNGDFSVGNYQQLFNETIDNYCQIAKDYRVIAAEFKKNYDAKNRNALSAYRQMNYYYIENNGVKTYMGDYFLNFPEKDVEFAEILFKGNLNIISNIRTLLSMGIGNTEKSYAQRISDAFGGKLPSSDVVAKPEYEDAVRSLRYDLEEMKSSYNNLLAEYKEAAELDQSNNFNKLETVMLETSFNLSSSFYELLKEIKIGDANLGDCIMNAPVIEDSMLYPIISASSEAEKLLLEYHSFYTTLLYDTIEKSDEDLESEMLEFEKNYEPISVFHGVQNDLEEGSVAVTGNTEISGSATGSPFIQMFTGGTLGATLGFTALGVGGIGASAYGIGYLLTKHGANVAADIAQRQTLKQALNAAYAKLQNQCEIYIICEYDLKNYSINAQHINRTKELMAKAGEKIQSVQHEIVQCSDDITNYVSPYKMTWGQIGFGSFMIALGAVMMGVSIWQLTKIYNKYDTKYTDVPDNMVDVVYNEKYGDRYVNYNNVDSYYYKDGKLANRENDLNAFGGSQWLSMYYTKNYEAGYCLTATPDLIAKETVREGYSSIHLFGHKQNVNLNSYCNRDKAEAVYLSFKYSTNQKSAETDIPDVIGSAFNTGTIAISGSIGFVLAVGLMTFIKRKRKKDEGLADKAELQ